MADLRNKCYQIILLGYYWLLPTLLFAQNGANPFDLQHRLSEQKSVDTLSLQESTNPFDIESRVEKRTPTTQISPPANENSTAAPTSKPTNPFDIRRSGIDAPQVAPPAANPDPAPLIERETTANKRGGFLFWSILGGMILLALLVTLYRSLLGKIYRAFSNENVLKLLQREQGGTVKPPYWWLYLLYFLNVGIFIFLLAHYYNTIAHQFNALVFCVLGVTGFFLAKHLILKLIEGIFPISKAIKQYSFTIVIFNIILGIILIPFNVFIAFAPDNLTFFGIILSLIVISAVYFFRLLRSIMISAKYLIFHKFHFFMYLCTIEIAPLLIIVKLLMNGASIQ